MLEMKWNDFKNLIKRFLSPQTTLILSFLVIIVAGTYILYLPCLAKEARSSFIDAIFNRGGTLAFGVGPLFITYVVGSCGLEASPLTLLAGFTVMATLPLGVAMAQELAPKGRSIVSSLMMGLAFATGGMMTPLTGNLADIYSIPAVLVVIAVVPFLTIVLISLLPEKKLKYEQAVV